MVLQVTRLYAMQGFRSDNQYLELYSDANWQPGVLKKQQEHVHIHTAAFWINYNILLVFQGISMKESYNLSPLNWIAVMCLYEWLLKTIPIWEWVQLAHKGNLFKGPLGYSCHQQFKTGGRVCTSLSWRIVTPSKTEDGRIPGARGIKQMKQLSLVGIEPKPVLLHPSLHSFQALAQDFKQHNLVSAGLKCIIGCHDPKAMTSFRGVM